MIFSEAFFLKHFGRESPVSVPEVKLEKSLKQKAWWLLIINLRREIPVSCTFLNNKQVVTVILHHITLTGLIST